MGSQINSAQPIWRVSVQAPPAFEDVIAAILESELERPASIFRDLRENRSTISVYLEDRKQWGRPVRQRLLQWFDELTSHDLDAASVQLRFQRVGREDWSESWKKHFRPFEIGRALLIRPSWSRRRAKSGQRVVVLDPGLSFGTGQHATTRFCLEQIAKNRPALKSMCSFLDVGTGTGILAVAAAKLGFNPIEAYDCDPVAVDTAQQNAKRNRVQERMRIRAQDLTASKRAATRNFDLICANLTADLLIDQHRKLAANLSARGKLVLAGVIREQFAQVAYVFEQAGLKKESEKSDGEWHSAVFSRR